MKWVSNGQTGVTGKLLDRGNYMTDQAYHSRERGHMRVEYVEYLVEDHL